MSSERNYNGMVGVLGDRSMRRTQRDSEDRKKFCCTRPVKEYYHVPYRTLAFDDTNNLYSYKTHYGTIK